MKGACCVAALLALLALAAACGGGSNEAPASPPPATLKPADAERPAAGVCAPAPEGGVVTITLNQDAPDPRCAQVRPSQQVRVVNRTMQVARVRLADLQVAVPPDDEWLFNVPVGEYFEMGVHRLEVSGSAESPELWLVEE